MHAASMMPRAMKSRAASTAPPARSVLSTTVPWLLGTGALSATLAWRFSTTPWEFAQTFCQVLLFALGCWFLHHDATHPGQGSRIVNILVTGFTLFRYLSYTGVGFLLPNPPPQYATLFGNSAGGYLGFTLFMAIGMFQQVVLRRILPAWLCTLLGSTQALLHTRVCYRYADPRTTSSWLVVRMIATHQAGMFGPYSMWAHYFRQPAAKQPPQAMSAKSNVQTDQSTHGIGGELRKDGTSAGVGSLSEAEAAGTRAQQAETDDVARVQETALKATSPERGCSQAAAQPHARVAAATAIEKLVRAPYKSGLRLVHTVCIKLDTQVPYTDMPHDLGQQLQTAIRTSIGYTHIADMAVRPGCICITMRLEEHRDIEERTSTVRQPQLTSHLTTEALAHTLMPQLQRILEGMQCDSTDIILPQASLQLNSECVTCIWSGDEQAWQVRAIEATSSDAVASSAWLGIATAYDLQPASAMHGASDSAAGSARGLMEVVAEVQLWGVSKVADVEGWTPPSEHQAEKQQVRGLRQQEGSNLPFKLLARMAGQYCQTQVVRLSASSNADCVVIKVLVQLHEHQLIRHHEGGTPSTLLLMDLELWQNEVLLSSSPLLSLTNSGTAQRLLRRPPACWWWGASDTKVAGAIDQLQECAADCMQASSDPNAPAPIQTYIQYVQDVAAWLRGVQATAWHSQTCRCCPQQPKAGKHSVLTPQVSQVTLPPAALQQLGCELMHYAQHMGWHRVRQMVSQQLQHVVARAPAACTLHGAQHCPRSTLQRLASELRVVVFGYPCHHDEQFYKQQLAGLHTTGVLMMSSTANVLIAVAWAARQVRHGEQNSQLVFLAAGWALLHFVAILAVVLQGPSSSSAGRGSSHSTPLPLKFTVWAFVWRVGSRVLLAAARAPAYLALHQRPRDWIVLEFMLAFTEQLQAITMLPAVVMVLLTACVDVLATLAASPSSTMTPPVLLMFRLLLDGFMRHRLVSRMRAPR